MQTIFKRHKSHTKIKSTLILNFSSEGCKLNLPHDFSGINDCWTKWKSLIWTKKVAFFLSCPIYSWLLLPDFVLVKEEIKFSVGKLCATPSCTTKITFWSLQKLTSCVGCYQVSQLFGRAGFPSAYLAISDLAIWRWETHGRFIYDSNSWNLSSMGRGDSIKKT